MDIRPIPDTRYTELTGTTKEFELLGEGLDVLDSGVDEEHDVLGQNVPWSSSYFEELRGKLPDTAAARRGEKHTVAVDNDELSALCSGLRMAFGEVRRMRAVTNGVSQDIRDGLERKGTAYHNLRVQIKRHVTYDPERA